MLLHTMVFHFVLPYCYFLLKIVKSLPKKVLIDCYFRFIIKLTVSNEFLKKLMFTHITIRSCFFSHSMWKQIWMFKHCYAMILFKEIFSNSLHTKVSSIALHLIVISQSKYVHIWCRCLFTRWRPEITRW